MKSNATSVLVVALSSGLLLAQSESGRATLEGSVSDATGRVIAAAAVAIRETQTGLERKLTTNAEGEFRAAALPVGVYTVEATASGFAASRAENLALTVGETKRANFTLQVASVSTAVTVVGDTQVVNLADASNSISINARA